MTVLETQELCTYLARTSWPHGQGWLVPCWLFSTPLPRRALREGLCLGSAWGAAIKSEKFQPWKIFPLVLCGWSFILVDVNCILSCTCHLLVVPLPPNSVLGLASLLASGPTRLHFVGPSTNTGSSQQGLGSGKSARIMVGNSNTWSTSGHHQEQGKPIFSFSTRLPASFEPYCCLYWLHTCVLGCSWCWDVKCL